MDLQITSPLGQFLRERRARVTPASQGFSAGRRRTPGLRREEVAQLANISPTWYTWLEQGRGGAPSREVLARIANALLLTTSEREHLFLLAFGHLPQVHYQQPQRVSPRLQRVLDVLPAPALIKTATWDVLAWNRPACVVLNDFSALAPSERNVLRQLFTDPRARHIQANWLEVARFAVGAFRADAARVGANAEIRQLVDELSAVSEEFAALWRSNDVVSHGEGIKRLHHPAAGALDLEFSSFVIEGEPALSMTVFNPENRSTAAKIARLLAQVDDSASEAGQ